MARSGGRMNLADALNRNVSSRLNPLTADLHSDSKHASVCRLERELKAVKEENSRLKSQLEDTRDALKEITVEASLEKFDERRVNLLKLQIIQLQRQVVLMTEALGSRSAVLMEVENALTWLSSKFRHYVGLDVKGPNVPISRADLMSMVDTSESARIKLFKGIENCSQDNLSRSPMFANPFLKTGMEKEYTMLDCCLGRPNCLNLQHVAQLEGKLSMLYRELVKVSENLATAGEGRGGSKASGSHITNTVHDREDLQLLRACAMARDCAAHLMSLSLLVPAAPWPPLKKPVVQEISLDAVIASLPPLSRSKAAQVQQCVAAALKACNHRAHMASLEAGALKEEVQFHQAVYQLQLDYVLQAFDALRDGYEEFEKSANEVLIQPMKKLMQAYDTLKKKSNEQGLKTFLTVLKEHHSQWEDAIQKLDISNPQHESGSVALSVFAHDFLNSLDRMLLARQTQRDKASSQKEELRAWQQQLEQELRTLINDNQHRHPPGRDSLLGGDCDPTSDAHDPTRNTHDPISALDHTANLHQFAGPHTHPSSTGMFPRQEANSNLHIDLNTNPAKAKKEKKTSRKPWMGVGDDSSSKMSGRKSSMGEGPGEGHSKAESEVEFGLRSWLDEPAYNESGERKPDWVSGVEPQEENGGPPSSNSTGGSLGKKGARRDHAATQSHTHKDISSPQAEAASLDPQGSSSTGSNSQRSVLRHNEHSPFHSARGDFTNTPESDRPTWDGLHQPGSVLSLSNTGFPDITSASGRPIASSESGSKPPFLGPKKSKGRTTTRNYQPKLYVANKTLTLRRSGSLSKLSEPSLEERMMKTSNSRPSSRESSGSRLSSR